MGALLIFSALLARAQVRAPFVHLRLIPIRQPQDDLVRSQSFRCADHFLIGRIWPAKLQILHHRSREQKILLRHDSDLFVQRFNRCRKQIDPIHQNPPFLRLIKSRDQADDAGLA